MVVEEADRRCGAKPTGWVHGGSREGSADQDVEDKDKADGEAGDLSGPPLVHAGGKYSEHEEEGQNRLHSDCRGYVGDGSQLRRA